MDNLYFWGIFLVITGVALMARVILKIQFPVAKILAAVFFILLGLKVLSGSLSVWPLGSAENEIFFKTVEIELSGELPPGYQIVFSRTRFDLEKMEMPEKTGLSINSIFSGSTVYLPSDLPVNIRFQTVFATIRMPGRILPVFGRGYYSSTDFNPDLPHLDISVNVVFGNVTFMRKV
jgi:predicted membrane protein